MKRENVSSPVTVTRDTLGNEGHFLRYCNGMASYPSGIMIMHICGLSLPSIAFMTTLELTQANCVHSGGREVVFLSSICCIIIAPF